jgi:TRAP-type C4-dicarboxylate transport system permease large subunit
VIAPMLLPALKAVGIDEVHFGVITVVAMGIGMYTPPVGVALFMLQDLCEISFGEAVRAVMPFVGALLVALAIITYVRRSSPSSRASLAHAVSATKEIPCRARALAPGSNQPI